MERLSNLGQTTAATTTAIRRREKIKRLSLRNPKISTSSDLRKGRASGSLDVELRSFFASRFVVLLLVVEEALG